MCCFTWHALNNTQLQAKQISIHPKIAHKATPRNSTMATLNLISPERELTASSQGSLHHFNVFHIIQFGLDWSTGGHCSHHGLGVELSEPGREGT